MGLEEARARTPAFNTVFPKSAYAIPYSSWDTCETIGHEFTPDLKFEAELRARELIADFYPFVTMPFVALLILLDAALTD